MDNNNCKWVSAPNAFAYFGEGDTGNQSTWTKTATCPNGFIMAGTRMFAIAEGVDEEHVDAYCCALN
ncbi:shufflon protein C' [Salmonella enterica subsp. enterica serovar Legon]|nr:shufflon protein C' [Salmonella enterica subsp. enterica serovar Derby]ECG3145629.1 shufflon protein C' [Salmonella enterica subsp. enterica serovar Weybridge]EDS6807263.1 shufflon protein C' [Salmonella enterica subsp. enterica serovar Legon]